MKTYSCVTIPLKANNSSDHAQNNEEEDCHDYAVYRTSGGKDMQTVLPGILQVVSSHNTDN